MHPLGDPFAPSSSPPSSPSIGPTDSSPASSPVLGPAILDSPPIVPGLLHPFAASSRADRRPPLYEKKLNTPPVTPPSNFISKASNTRVFKDSYEQDVYLNESSSGRVSQLAPLNWEAQLWDECISNAVDSGHGLIDLSSRHLTYIPESIGDLRNFYVLSQSVEHENVTGGRLFSRTRTTPNDILSSHIRSFERTPSFADPSAGQPREEIRLFLSANEIYKLPRELFSVTRMTVLALRNNQLTYIPPEMANLTNLQELNIANNRLKYLPAEMLQMKLKSLILYPNHFLSEPTILTGESPRREGELSRRRSMTRVWSQRAAKANHCASVSATTLVRQDIHIPSLSELCLRVLMSPCRADIDYPSTNLADLYTLPIPGEWGPRIIPPSLQQVLNACVPTSVSSLKTISPNVTPRGYTRKLPLSSKSDSYDREIMGIGVCPNPSHRYKAVFVRHIEERFTWENIVAGCDIGGMVPLQWRGCLQGCLVFLDGRDGTQQPNVNSRLPQPLPRVSNAEDMSMNVEDDDDDEDIEMDDGVVQAINLAQAEFGDEDFEDDA